MAVEIRRFRPADREAAHAVRVQAFATERATYEAGDDDDYVPDDRRLVADDDGVVVGHTAVWEHAHWFGRRAVPSGGVASVAVLPTHRRRGIASALLRQAIRDMRGRGEVVSALFPMTAGLYRRHGWELAGVHPHATVPTRALASLSPPARDVDLRPATAADVPAMEAVHEAVSRTQPGNLRRLGTAPARALAPDDEAYAYVAERDGEVVGHVLYEHRPTDEPGAAYRIDVRELVGADGDVERTLWRLVGTSASAAATVSFVTRPDEPLLWWLPEGSDVRPAPFVHHWMLRLVDVPAAIAARGYADGPAVAVPLRIADPLVPDNDGAFVLEAGGGEARLVAGGPGRASIDVGGLASLYSGWASASTLAHAGRLTGASADDVRTLDDLFAGRAPWVRTYF